MRTPFHLPPSGTPRAGLLLGLGLLVGAFAAAPAAAQDGEDEARQRWVTEGELTAVLSRGNSESLTLGLGATVRRRWDRDEFRFEAGWVQVETGRITRRAVGSPDDFSVEREVDTETTAEALTARGRYDRTLSEDFFLFGGVDWLRNTFAGIESRFLLAAGGGNTWADSDRTRFSTNYAVTYTFEEDVVENPFVKQDFAGLRAGYDLFRRISSSARLESDLVGDLNLEETEDVRLESTTSLSVDVNSSIALKPSLKLNWRNQPALTEVPLFTPGGTDTGETVQAPLRKLDTLFKLALVVTL